MTNLCLIYANIYCIHNGLGYSTTIFVKSLHADFLRDGRFNSRLFNTPKAQDKSVYLKKSELTSVPLKKIVTCIGIYSLCLNHELYSKFLFHIANSSCQKL